MAIEMRVGEILAADGPGVASIEPLDVELLRQWRPRESADQQRAAVGHLHRAGLAEVDTREEETADRSEDDAGIQADRRQAWTIQR